MNCNSVDIIFIMWSQEIDEELNVNNWRVLKSFWKKMEATFSYGQIPKDKIN